jgi:Ca-activated chloride channel family protein
MLQLALPWLLALLPLPWVLRRWWPHASAPVPAVRVPFVGRLRAAAELSGTRAHPAARRQLLPALVWALLVLALARPQWLDPPLERRLPTRDLLLLVDLSLSMRQQDFSGAGGAAVDRLAAVKEVLGEFLLRREGDRVGLVVFGDAAFLQAPFSSDLALVRQLLEGTAIGMAGARTALGDAIGLGITLFESSTLPAKTLIALTDGNDTASLVPPIEAARIARARGIRIHTVAIGDPVTAGEERLDEVTLREVAQTGGGRYFFAGDRAGLEAIYAELDRIETRQVQTIGYRPRRELFHWPLAGALLLSLGGVLPVLRPRRDAGAATAASETVHVDPHTGVLEVRP